MLTVKEFADRLSQTPEEFRVLTSSLEGRVWVASSHGRLWLYDGGPGDLVKFRDNLTPENSVAIMGEPVRPSEDQPWLDPLLWALARDMYKIITAFVTGNGVKNAREVPRRKKFKPRNSAGGRRAALLRTAAYLREGIFFWAAQGHKSLAKIALHRKVIAELKTMSPAELPAWGVKL